MYNIDQYRLPWVYGNKKLHFKVGSSALFVEITLIKDSAREL